MKKIITLLVIAFCLSTAEAQVVHLYSTSCYLFIPDENDYVIQNPVITSWEFVINLNIDMIKINGKYYNGMLLEITSIYLINTENEEDMHLIEFVNELNEQGKIILSSTHIYISYENRDVLYVFPINDSYVED